MLRSLPMQNTEAEMKRLSWSHLGQSPKSKLAMQDAEVGRALRSKPVTAVVGEGACRTLFVHAGLQLGQLTQLQLHKPLQGEKGEELLGFLNEETLGASPYCRSSCMVLAGGASSSPWMGRMHATFLPSQNAQPSCRFSIALKHEGTRMMCFHWRNSTTQGY